MSYSGMVSSEYSSGRRIQRGGITKTGNSHLRRVIVEAAWAYQHNPIHQSDRNLREAQLILAFYHYSLTPVALPVP
jgi:transposase